jgi:hypothetical protein
MWHQDVALPDNVSFKRCINIHPERWRRLLAAAASLLPMTAAAIPMHLGT